MSGFLGFREESPAVDVPAEDDSSYDFSSQSSYSTSHSRSSSGSIHSTSTSATDNEAYQNLKLDLDLAQENLVELHQKYADLERTSKYTKGQLENEIDFLRLQLQRLKDKSATPPEQATPENKLEAAAASNAEHVSRLTAEHAELEAAKASADARVQELEAAAASSAEHVSRLTAEHAELEAAKASADARVQELVATVLAVAKLFVGDSVNCLADVLVENKMAGGSGDAVVVVRELERVRNEQRKEREAGTAQLKDEIRLIKKELARAEAEKAEATRNREVVEREVRRRAEATELSGLLSGQENSVGSRVKHYRSMCPVCAVM